MASARRCNTIVESIDDVREYLATRTENFGLKVFGERWVKEGLSEFGVLHEASMKMVECRFSWEWADVTLSNGYDFLFFGNQDGEHPDEIIDDVLSIFLGYVSGDFVLHENLLGPRMTVSPPGGDTEFMGRLGKRSNWFHRDGPFARMSDVP